MSEELRHAKWKDRLLWLFGRRHAFRVEGDSMLPTVRDGDAVLIETAFDLAVGDIVLAEHPYRKGVKILKRVAEIDLNGNLSLTGDNPSESTDSRSFGAFSVKSIVGKVVCKLK
jgi:nickel-type superoxide dismutase maturation protease